MKESKLGRSKGLRFGLVPAQKLKVELVHEFASGLIVDPP